MKVRTRPNPTNPEIEIELKDESETQDLGMILAEISRPGLVVGLDGSLGAGKTRLVRAWAESLGVDPQAISSPTFVLIHEYAGSMPIYHFDAYRLSGLEEFDGIGGSDYFLRGDGLCLIEWAERIDEALPIESIRIRIEWLETEGGGRRLTIRGNDARFLSEIRAKLSDFDDSASAN